MKLHELATKVNELMADVVEGKLSPNTPVVIINSENGGEIYLPTKVELETHYDGDVNGIPSPVGQTIWIGVIDQ